MATSMTTTSDEQRLLLLAAVAMTRGGLDGYLTARLATFGYTREQAECAARALLAAAGETATLAHTTETTT